MASVEEQYAPAIHKHPNCPICNNVALIEDIQPPRNRLDELLLQGRNIDARLRTLWGKRIEIKEGK